MPRMKMSVVFLMCCLAVGVAQENSGAQQQAPAASGQAVSVPASEMLGIVDHKVLPQYPKKALMKGIQGDVVFNVVVDKSGKIASSKLVSGDPLLVAASEDAIRQYRFRPYTVDGSAVRVKSQLGFHFTAAHEGDSTHGQVECMFTTP
jgi:periplasmic protein TonB